MFLGGRYKKGYHSTQRKVFHTIPYSEFLGIAIRYAIGMIAHGLLKWNGSVLELVGIAAGFPIYRVLTMRKN